MHLSGAIHLSVVLQVKRPPFALLAPAYPFWIKVALLERLGNFTRAMYP